MFNDLTQDKYKLEKVVSSELLKWSRLDVAIKLFFLDNKDKVVQYKSGKDKLFVFFVGQTMKASGGKANPKLVNDILKQKLK